MRTYAVETPPRSHTLSSGRRFASPFRVPRLAGAMVYGTFDLAAVQRRFADERVHPVATASGVGLGCLWLSDFGESTVGPYRELTVTVLVAESALTVDWRNLYTPFAAQLREDTLVCEYVLILDNPDAIDYGRELHGFDKQAGRLRFATSRDWFDFEVLEADGRIAVRGGFREGGVRALPGALVGLARAHGVLPTARALVQRTHRLRVITPKTVRACRSDLYFSGRMLLYPWEGRLETGDGAVGRLVRELDFRPTCVQRVFSGEGLMPEPRA